MHINYIAFLYYIHNLDILGEHKTIIYTNKYINHLEYNCIYEDQKIINSFCPTVPEQIPEFFISLF